MRKRTQSISSLPLQGCQQAAERHGNPWLKAMMRKAKYHLKRAENDPEKRELQEKLAILEGIVAARDSELARLQDELKSTFSARARMERKIPLLKKKEGQLQWEIEQAKEVSVNGRGELSVHDPEFWRKLGLLSYQKQPKAVPKNSAETSAPGSSRHEKDGSRWV